MLEALDPKDPRYLLQLMMWRVYGWGLDIIVQKQLGFDWIENGTEFYDNWKKVRNSLGKKSLKVTMYGRKYFMNVPTTLDGMEEIWNYGTKLWAKWIEHNPLTFVNAQTSIVSEGLPIYTSGKLSHLLLLGDLVHVRVVIPPMEVEMATMVIDANAGAYNGLKILGCERDER
jgi:hypothetical protein